MIATRHLFGCLGRFYENHFPFRHMVFSSVTFLFFFLPLTLALYYATPVRFVTVRNTVLSVCSLLFYAWGEPGNILLLPVMAAFNYAIGAWLPRCRRRRALLAVAVTINLGGLFYYKYAAWALVMLPDGWATALRFGTPALPLGISFFTFHAISYLTDIYRKDIAPARGWLDFACYFVMFPHLVAGPIVRFSHVAGDLAGRRNDFALFYEGLRRLTVGLAKKMLVANQMAAVADIIFALPSEQLPVGTAWLGALAYSLQIYFDFSGYSDMAIGLAAMFGLRFHENFQHPYAAASMQDFWRRWHISLSSWLRDYLYFPIGGSRHGAWRTHVNLLMVFFLCGLWHGANWTFVAWGLWHGLFLALERRPSCKRLLERAGVLGHAYVALVFVVGWVLFRSTSLEHALGFLRALARTGGIPAPAVLLPQISPVFWLALGAGIVGASGVPAQLWRRMEGAFSRDGKSGCWELGRLLVGATLLGLSVMALMAGTYNPFIYFRF
jgi:alginate O-acetyltransferase complex protein AlgI